MTYTKEKQKEWQKKYYKKNKEKILAKNRAYYQENRENILAKSKSYNRKYNEKNKDRHADQKLKSRYGITREDYNRIFDIQEGRCPICGKHQSELATPLTVDHDHSTGKVRGLLCSLCNQAIGMLNDDPEILYNAILYLE